VLLLVVWALLNERVYVAGPIDRQIEFLETKLKDTETRLTEVTNLLKQANGGFDKALDLIEDRLNLFTIQKPAPHRRSADDA